MEEEELCYSPYVHRYGNSRRGFADDYVRELAVRLDGHFIVSGSPLGQNQWLRGLDSTIKNAPVFDSGRFWAFLEKSSFVEK